MAVGTALLHLLNEGLEWGIPQDVWQYIWGLVIAYLAVEGAADVVSRAKGN